VTALVEGFNGQFLLVTPSRAWDLHIETPVKASDPGRVDQMYEQSKAWLEFLAEHTSLHVAGNRASPSGFSLCVSRRKTIRLIKAAGGKLPGGGGAADYAAAAARRRSAQLALQLEALEEEEKHDMFGDGGPPNLQSTRVPSTPTGGRYMRPSAVVRQQVSDDALEESMSEAGLGFDSSDDSDALATSDALPSDARDEPPPPSNARPLSVHVAATPPLRPASAPASSSLSLVGEAPHQRTASAPAPPRSVRPQSTHAAATPPIRPAETTAADFVL
jgi:hypothetical protein